MPFSASIFISFSEKSPSGPIRKVGLVNSGISLRLMRSKATSQCATKVISGFTFLIKSESFVTSLIFGKKNLKLCLEAATACFLSFSMFRFLRSVFSVFRIVISEIPISVAFSTKNSILSIFLVGAIAICNCLVRFGKYS